MLMLTEAHLTQEFTKLVERTYPQVSDLLRQSHLKLVTVWWGKPRKRLDYIAIYCSDALFQAVIAHKEAYRSISRYMGLAEPVCINATRLLRDPMSRLKEDAPRFWLELHCLLPSHSPEV